MRDLQRDLEIIRAATRKPWKVVVDDYGGEDWLIADFGEAEVGGKMQTVIITTDHVRGDETAGALEDARFCVEARNGGWEEAIQRALAAENQVKLLRKAIRDHCEVCVFGQARVIEECPYTDCCFWPWRFKLAEPIAEGGERDA